MSSGSEDANRLSRAMNASILTMLAAPYLLFAGICGLLVRAVRRAQRERETKLAARGSPGAAPDHQAASPAASGSTQNLDHTGSA